MTITMPDQPEVMSAFNFIAQTISVRAEDHTFTPKEFMQLQQALGVVAQALNPPTPDQPSPGMTPAEMREAAKPDTPLVDGNGDPLPGADGVQPVATG